MNKSLAEMAEEVEKNNIKLGWYDADRTFGEDIALLHSEVSEALEAYRKELTDPYWVDPNSGMRVIGRAPATIKPEGVGSEFADILIRLLDSAKRYSIDIEEEYELKMAFNRARSYRHGNKAL